eukprot:5374327-Amphidinium_carterae.1
MSRRMKPQLQSLLLGRGDIAVRKFQKFSFRDWVCVWEVCRKPSAPKDHSSASTLSKDPSVTTCTGLSSPESNSGVGERRATQIPS